MSRLVTVSRAAKLAGVSRGNLQRQIRDGAITSFEGMVDLEQLAQQYPSVNFEADSLLEKLEQIIENASIRARSGKVQIPPDMETLATRVNILSEELVESKLEISIFYNIFDKLKTKLNALANSEPEAAKAIRNLQSWLLTEIESVADKKFEQYPILATDTFLRIMAAQVRVEPSGHEFFVEGSDSILESGLSSGLALNYGCSNGNCGKCKAKVLSGEVKKTRHHDYVLNEKEKLQGYILTCSNTAVTDIIIEAEEAGSEKDIPAQSITAWVRKLVPLAGHMSSLQVKTPRTSRLRFLAGQYVSVEIPGVASKKLHIASCPCDDMNLQFHIDTDVDDEFTNYIQSQLKTNDAIEIEGPAGHFILREDESNPVVFIAFGHGFAPIKSLVEHAMTLDVSEDIQLYWLVPEKQGLYMHNHCRSWDDAFERFSYHPTVYGGNDAVQTLIDSFSDNVRDHRFYIAGSDSQITKTKNALQAQGIPHESIFTETA
jgi:CDP-4-dehydro-6-deoxyglucose reductase